MHIDFSVVTPHELSEELLEEIDKILKADDFEKDEYGYDHPCADVYINLNPPSLEQPYGPEQDPLPPEDITEIGFTPKAEIFFEIYFERCESVLETMAKLAKLLDGLMFNYFTGVYTDINNKIVSRKIYLEFLQPDLFDNSVFESFMEKYQFIKAEEGLTCGNKGFICSKLYINIAVCPLDKEELLKRYGDKMEEALGYAPDFVIVIESWGIERSHRLAARIAEDMQEKFGCHLRDPQPWLHWGSMKRKEPDADSRL